MGRGNCCIQSYSNKHSTQTQTEIAPDVEQNGLANRSNWRQDGKRLFVGLSECSSPCAMDGTSASTSAVTPLTPTCPTSALTQTNNTVYNTYSSFYIILSSDLSFSTAFSWSLILINICVVYKDHPLKIS